MSWQEELKRLLNIPQDAKIITRPYYRTIPKKSGKRYKALTIQYIHEGKRKYKHVKKEKEKIVINMLSGEDAAYEYAASKLKELKDFLGSIQDGRTKRSLMPLMREIDRLLLKISTRIF